MKVPNADPTPMCFPFLRNSGLALPPICLRQWTGIRKLVALQYQTLFYIQSQLNVCPASILPGRFAIFRTNPANPNATMDDLKAKHKKELKALDGEKRNQLKKTKATAGKGKKGKEALSA